MLPCRRILPGGQWRVLVVRRDNFVAGSATLLRSSWLRRRSATEPNKAGPAIFLQFLDTGIPVFASKAVVPGSSPARPCRAETTPPRSCGDRRPTCGLLLTYGTLSPMRRNAVLCTGRWWNHKIGGGLHYRCVWQSPHGYYGNQGLKGKIEGGKAGCRERFFEPCGSKRTRNPTFHLRPAYTSFKASSSNPK